MAEHLANYVKFLRGTPEAYKKLGNRVDNDTLYFVFDEDTLESSLYLGAKKVLGGETGGTPNIGIDDLRNVVVEEGLANKAFLSYDPATQVWLATSLDDLAFLPADMDANGESGLVPAPKAGDENHFLRGDGSWADIRSVIPPPHVFEATAASDKTNEEIITETVGDATLTAGDVIIISEPIVADKVHYVTYIYNGTLWNCLNKDYRVKDVYFDDNIVITEKIGAIDDIPPSGNLIFEAKGKNLHQVLSEILGKEKNPEITLPKVKCEISNSGNYEVGTVLSGLTYNATFEDGSYTYGPTPTGCTVTSWTITDSFGAEVGATANGPIPDITVADDTNFKIVALANYSDGNAALTNLGNDSGLLITQGETNSVESKAIIGYRNSFYGTLTEKGELTADVIRGLQPTNKTLKEDSAFDITIPVGAVRTIIAIPATLANPRKVIDENDSVNIVGNFLKNMINIDIPGANNTDSISYKVFYDDYAYANTVNNIYHVTI